MTDLITSENLVAWVAQTTILVAAAALLGRLIHARVARWHLAYLHVLLAICVLLPVLQRWDKPGRRALRPPAQTVTTSFGKTSPDANEPVDWAAYVPILLAAGAGCRIIWLCFGMSRLRRYRKNAASFETLPPSISSAFDLTKTQAQFSVSSEIFGPVTFGWLSPVVLVSPVFQGLSHDQQLAVACHELTHVRRRDWLSSLTEEVIAAVIWFHPGIWWLLRQIRLAREQVVDQAVIALTGSRQDYIDALLKIAESRWQLDLSPAPLFLKRRHLMDRVQQLVKEATMTRKQTYASYASTTAVLAVTAWFASIGFPLTAAPQFEAQQRLKSDAVLERISVFLPDPDRTKLRDRLAAYAGQPFTNQLMEQIGRDTAAIDRTLTTGWVVLPNGNASVELFRRTPGGLDPQPEFQRSAETRIRVGGAVAAQKRIEAPRPVYPLQAKQSRIQGLVRLGVLIGKDGRVADLYTMSGPPLLQEAAEEAVRKWVYQTTLLNGNPVEVVTVVDVNFTLAP
jgi:TonB family protein